MYGTTDKDPWFGKGVGFDAYWSNDLCEWTGPIPVFRPPQGFWADKDFWAPEVYLWNDKFVMFASFKAAGLCRAVHSFAAQSPLGPFLPLSDEPLTPLLWDCLDGTLFIDDDGKPWMVFCHEWTQIGDGEICALPLHDTLSKAVGSPNILFSAKKSGWSQNNTGNVIIRDGENFVTDGPFLYRLKSGALICIWSSFTSDGYAVGQARSISGRLSGIWEHNVCPIIFESSGHGMLFNKFDGNLFLALHHPNETPNERPVFLPMRERDGWLSLCNP